MTKEEFLNGTSFTVGAPRYKGDSTFTYNGSILCQESRSSIDGRVIISSYALNITKIGNVGFEGFGYVVIKEVKVKYRFEDLIVFKEN